MQAALASLQPVGAAAAPAKVSFDELKTIVGFPDYWAREERFAARD